jgi:hypothetical protein
VGEQKLAGDGEGGLLRIRQAGHALV